MADFKAAVEKLLVIEGGFSPRDNTCGAVNLGITSAFLKLIGRPCTTEDVRALTPDAATEIYREWFWNRFRLGGINSQAIAEALLICLVNTDPQEVIYALHEALAAVGKPVLPPEIPKRVRVLGGTTVSKLNEIDAAGWPAVMAEFKGRMLEHYIWLAQKNPAEFSDDLPGWKRRLESA